MSATNVVQNVTSDSKHKTFNHIPWIFKQAVLDTKNHQHHYTTPEGIRYPSITTLLGKTRPTENAKGIKAWRDRMGQEVSQFIFNELGIIGTEAHKLNENYLNNIHTGDDYRLLSHAHHNNFKPHLDRMDNVHGIEVQLYSDKLKVAGTSDCIAEYDGVLSVIDYKTKRSKQEVGYMLDPFIQTTAYSLMWEELTGNKVEQLIILASSEKNTMQKFVGKRDDYINKLNERITQYKP